MQEINLLQNRLQDTTVSWVRRKQLVLTFLSLVLILEIGLIIIFALWNRQVKQKTTATIAETAVLQTAFDAKQNDVIQAKDFQAQLQNVKTLVSNHYYSSPLLDELARFTYNKALYTNFSGGLDGNIHLEGKVASYTDLSKLLLGLATSPKFKSAKLLALDPAEGKVAGYFFSLELVVAPDLFNKK